MPPKKTRNGLIPVIGYKGISDAQLLGVRKKFTQNKVNKDFCKSSIIRAANDYYGEVAATIELYQAEGKSFTWHIRTIHMNGARTMDWCIGIHPILSLLPDSNLCVVKPRTVQCIAQWPDRNKT